MKSYLLEAKLIIILLWTISPGSFFLRKQLKNGIMDMEDFMGVYFYLIIIIIILITIQITLNKIYLELRDKNRREKDGK